MGRHITGDTTGRWSLNRRFRLRNVWRGTVEPLCSPARFVSSLSAYLCYESPTCSILDGLHSSYEYNRTFPADPHSCCSANPLCDEQLCYLGVGSGSIKLAFQGVPHDESPFSGNHRSLFQGIRVLFTFPRTLAVHLSGLFHMIDRRVPTDSTKLPPRLFSLFPAFFLWK